MIECHENHRRFDTKPHDSSRIEGGKGGRGWGGKEGGGGGVMQLHEFGEATRKNARDNESFEHTRLYNPSVCFRLSFHK